MTRSERLYQRVNALIRDGLVDEASAYVGLGNENIPNKPFGFAHNMERRAIRDHLRWRAWLQPCDDATMEFRITAIQQRLHRERPSLHDRQAAWRARQPATVIAGADTFLTWEEMEHLIDLFAGANDPVSAEIARKVALVLEKK